MTMILTTPSTWPSGVRISVNNSLLRRHSGKCWQVHSFQLDEIKMIRNLGWKWHRWLWCLLIPFHPDVIHRSSVIITHLDFILLIPCTRLTAGVRARTFIRVSFTTKTKRNFNSNNFYNSSASFSPLFRSPACSTRPPLPTLHLELVNLIEMAKLWFSML